jgi:hypothetical protein
VRWKRLYQESLGEALQLTGSLVIGGSDETCVADETVIGVDKQDGWTLGAKGISKHGAEQKRTTARRTQKLVKNNVLKRLPARSVQDRIGAEGFVQAGYEVKHYEGRQEAYDEEARCKLEEQRSLALGRRSRGHREQSVHP